MTAAYDIIGDIHGYADELTGLLELIGYEFTAGVYRHAGGSRDRKAVFLGDFIDRGPCQREVLSIVRPMVEQGHALAVMGNHELNALGWDAELRPHSEKNRAQHAAFLDAYADDAAGRRDVLGWFRRLPLCLDLEALRVVHACWDDEVLARVRPSLADDGTLPEPFLTEALTSGTRLFEDVEILLKGKEVPLPEGHSYPDREGVTRHRVRVKWWQGATTYRDAYLGHPSAVAHIPEEPIDGDYELDYPTTAPPVFVGHYWLDGDPEPLTDNVACLDYSVAREGGKLVAYCWDGEARLTADNFRSVPTGAA